MEWGGFLPNFSPRENLLRKERGAIGYGGLEASREERERAIRKSLLGQWRGKRT